jgi:hypothetical protein
MPGQGPQPVTGAGVKIGYSMKTTTQLDVLNVIQICKKVVRSGNGLPEN